MSNTQVAIDLLHKLEEVEAQRDELLQALELIASCDKTCYVDGHGYIDIEDVAKKAIANARLIAAAPELLEACEMIASLADKMDFPSIVLDQVFDAIAKAKGEV